MPGLAARVMSAGRRISVGCATTRAGCATAFVRARCRRWREAGSRDPADPRGRRAVRLQAVSVRREGVAQRAAAGDGDRRVRQGARRCATSSRCASRPGLGKLSKTTASRICEELRERFEAFKRHDLYDIQAGGAVPGRDLPARSGPTGPRRACWWPGASPSRASACCSAVMLGMRESHEDWLALGSDLIARGLGAPLLIVADGAPGSDQGHRAVLARLRPPTLRRSPRCATCSPSCPNGSASASARPTGRRSTTPPANATASNDSRA